MSRHARPSVVSRAVCSLTAAGRPGLSAGLAAALVVGAAPAAVLLGAVPASAQAANAGPERRGAVPSPTSSALATSVSAPGFRPRRAVCHAHGDHDTDADPLADGDARRRADRTGAAAQHHDRASCAPVRSSRSARACTAVRTPRRPVCCSTSSAASPAAPWVRVAPGRTSATASASSGSHRAPRPSTRSAAPPTTAHRRRHRRPPRRGAAAADAPCCPGGSSRPAGRSVSPARSPRPTSAPSSASTATSAGTLAAGDRRAPGSGGASAGPSPPAPPAATPSVPCSPATSQYRDAVTPSLPLVVDSRTLARGDSGGEVRLLQQRLAGAGVDVGPIDGQFGSDLRHAVTAFQKSQGLPRTGRYDEAHPCAAGRSAPPFALRYPAAGRAVEVDLTKQVLYLAEGGRREAHGRHQQRQRRAVHRRRRHRAGHHPARAASASSARSTASGSAASASCTARRTSSAAGPSTAARASRPTRPATAASASRTRDGPALQPADRRHARHGLRLLGAPPSRPVRPRGVRGALLSAARAPVRPRSSPQFCPGRVVESAVLPRPRGRVRSSAPAAWSSPQ